MPSPSSTLDLAGGSHVGRYRKRNEDSYVISLLGPELAVVGTSVRTPPEEWSLARKGGQPGKVDAGDSLLILAVADGVGGGPGGDVASQLAVSLFPGAVQRRLPEGADITDVSDEEMGSLLTEAVLEVHGQVVEAGSPSGDHPGMASTFTAWISVDDHAWLVQVGDSRCYRFRDGSLTRLSTDQTLAQDLFDGGSVSDVNAVADIYHNTLTSTVGGHESRPVVTRLDREPGDVILVCSDGVTKHVEEEQLAHLLAAPMDVPEMLSTIFEVVLEDGATDNLTAIIARDPS